MREPAGRKRAVQIRRVAGDLKPRRESVRQRCGVVAGIVLEIVDGRIDVAIGILAQPADDEVPVGAEIVFEPRRAQVGLQVDPGITLAVADAGGTWRRRQHDLFTVGEPAWVSLVDQVIVAVVELEYGLLRQVDIESEIPERAALMTFVDPAVAAADESVEAKRKYSGLVDGTAEIGMGGCDGVAVVGDADATQVVIGRPLGDEVEHARWIGWTVQR